MDTQKYEQILGIVSRYNLVSLVDVTDDEYEPEARDIANRAGVLSENDLAEYIYDVFRFWFGAKLIPSKDNYVYGDMTEEIKDVVGSKYF